MISGGANGDRDLLGLTRSHPNAQAISKTWQMDGPGISNYLIWLDALRDNYLDTHRYAGISVSSAGDLKDDGLDDIIIGAPGSGPGY